jgi:hypothetical protein
MSTCGRLFTANKIYAYYVAAQKHVVILADVILNPTADAVHICPNPIAMPPSREFIVLGTTSPGIHPALAVVRRVSTSYASDLTPRSVIVYSAGIDAPVRQEVPVTSAPPPPLPSDTPVHVPPPPPKPSHGPIEVTGYSPTFSLEQAVQDALAQAAAEFPAPPRNPDVAVEIDIKDISARAGGNIRPGLFVRATAR